MRDDRSLLMALVLVLLLFVLLGGGMMSGTMMQGGMMGHGTFGGVSWMWVPTLLTLLVGILLGAVLFGRTE